MLILILNQKISWRSKYFSNLDPWLNDLSQVFIYVIPFSKCPDIFLIFRKISKSMKHKVSDFSWHMLADFTEE